MITVCLLDWSCKTVTFTWIFSKIGSLSLLSVNSLLGEREKNKTYKSHIFSHYSVRGSIYIIMKIWISRFGKNWFSWILMRKFQNLLNLILLNSNMEMSKSNATNSKIHIVMVHNIIITQQGSRDWLLTGAWQVREPRRSLHETVLQIFYNIIVTYVTFEEPCMKCSSQWETSFSPANILKYFEKFLIHKILFWKLSTKRYFLLFLLFLAVSRMTRIWKGLFSEW